MGRAHEEFISAALSWRPGFENRLTEIFATVLCAHLPLVEVIFEPFGLDAGERVEVFTQELLFAGAKPDMVIRSFDARNVQVGELWSEHKTQSDFRPLQLEQYRDALSGRDAGLLAIVASDDERPPDSKTWQSMTWQAVAERSDRLGTEWADGSGWREHALLPDTPAKWRLLHELITYLELEDLATVQHLTRQSIVTFANVAETLWGVQALLEATAPRVSLDSEGAVEWDTDDYDQAWVMFELPPQHRILRRVSEIDEEAYGEVCIVSKGPYGAPGFWAGVTLPKELLSQLATDAEWLTRLTAAQLELTEFRYMTRVMRFLAMEDLVGEDRPLSEQAADLARHTDAAIAASADLDLLALEPIPRQGRRASGAHGAPPSES